MYAIYLSLLMMFMHPYYFECMITPCFAGWTGVPSCGTNTQDK